MRKFKRMTAFFLMMVLVATTVPALADASWETMVRDEYFLNDTWRYRAENADASVQIDTETARGNASLKLTRKTGKDSTNRYITASNKSVSVENGKTYRMEFEVKAKNALAASIILDGVSTNLVPSANTYDWMPVALTYHSKKNGNIEFRFTLSDRAEGFWVDNIKFYDLKDPGVNLVKDGDFEDLSGIKEIISEKAETAGSTDDMYSKYGTMQIDGKLDDWEGYEAFEITGLQDYTNYVWKNVAPQMVGYVRYAHDDKNFYFAVDVEDQTHYPFPDTNNYWKGDSLQFGWADPRLESPSQVERGAAYYPENGVIHKYKDDFDVAIIREGTKTYYEVAIPWTSDFSGEMPPDILFNLAVNSNDGNGRDYSIELAPGITNGKEVKYYKHLNLWQSVGNIEQSTSAPRTANAFDNVTATISLKNETNRAERVEITVPKVAFSQQVTVEPKSTKNVNIPYKVGDVGIYQLDITIESGGEKVNLTKNTIVQIIYDAESYPTLRRKLVAQEREIRELLLQCEKKGMKPPYEIANHAILERFIRLLDEEALTYNDFDRMYQYEVQLTKIYTETKESLLAYLAGEKEPLAVPKYITGSELKLDGTSVIATTDTNGIKEERPIFFSGYGHFESTGEDTPFFQDIGANMVQMGLNYRDVYSAFVQDYISGFIAETHGDCDATIEGTTEEAASGKHSLKIVNRSKKANGVSANIQQRVEVEPNTTYVYGFKAKGKNVNYTYLLQEWNFNNTQRFIQSSDDWQEYSVEFTTPKLMGENETFIQIISEDIVDELYIDDIYVVKKGTQENLLYEGDFETSLRELTPVEKEVKEHGFAVNYFGINKLRRYLEAAEQNNILVDICLCYHYFEDSRMVKTDPDAYAYYGRYMPFDPQNETVRTLHKLWTKVMGEVLNDYDSVHSICILNEPQFLPYTSEAYVPQWQAYLKNKYGTLDKLNEVYESSYKSFAEIEMPKNVEETVRFYDYRNFNEDILTEFQEFLAKEVKAACPDKLIHSKIMGFLRKDYYIFLGIGADPERVGDLYDINGCDISVHYKNAYTSLALGMSWIDYMISIADKPVWDTEAHPLTDRVFVEYRDDLEPVYVAASVWNGAVHGRQGSAMWLWETSYNLSMWNKNTWANANFRHRPVGVAEMAKVNLDLMRLSKEITAIQKQKAEVGILMSRTSQGYTKNHMEEYNNAYESIIFSGQKVGFVTDLQPENVHKYKLLIIPAATHVKADMLEHIKTFIENGGKVVILGTDSLIHDEHNKPHDAELVDYIYNHADTGSTVKETISSMGMSDVVLIDTETGKTPEKVEWSYAEYEGKMVVNVLNHDFEINRTFKVLYQGKEIATMTDLRSMEQFNGTVTATPYEALLLSFDK